MPQLLSPHAVTTEAQGLKPVLCNKRRHCNEKFAHSNEEVCSPQLEKSHVQQRRPNTVKNNQLINLPQMVKNLPAMQEAQVRRLDQEDPLEKEMATHSSILAWRIQWTEEPGGLQSMGGKKSDKIDRLTLSLFIPLEGLKAKGQAGQNIIVMEYRYFSNTVEK